MVQGHDQVMQRVEKLTDSNLVHLAQEFLNLTISLYSPTPRYQSANVWQDSISLLYKLKLMTTLLKTNWELY